MDSRAALSSSTAAARSIPIGTPIDGYPLPADLAAQLEIYCRLAGDSPADFVADAVALQLDRLAGAVPAAEEAALLCQVGTGATR